jgi:tetratricopeptide (TPR) repeat protein
MTEPDPAPRDGGEPTPRSGGRSGGRSGPRQSSQGSGGRGGPGSREAGGRRSSSAAWGGAGSGRSGRRQDPGRRGRQVEPGRPAPRGRDAAADERRAAIEQRSYDPRREQRRALSRVPLPDDVDAAMLDPEVRRELRSLAKDTADLVARHLVVVGRTLDDDPETALRHARAARALAGRVGAVREAAGLAAYTAGEWAEALTELRAARRITGQADHLAVLADCERALGRPERALAYGDDPAVPSLSQPARVELVIVLSGARRDLGQADAAVLLLQDPARRTRRNRPWAARLWYALADALLEAGRPEQAREWFVAAAEVDESGETDADDRLLSLDGVVLEDLQAGDDQPDDQPDVQPGETDSEQGELAGPG